MIKPAIYGLVGPSASGKTAVSLEIAARIGCEIVCMDSMQVYQGMDIGTAKPTAEERGAIPHHMLDVCDPREDYTVAAYQTDARRVLSDILSRGKTPLLVGGTGLYLRALSEDMALGGAAGNEEIREKYREYAAKFGANALHALLAARSPGDALRLHPNDTRRVIRALEILETTGLSPPRDEKNESPYEFHLFALDRPREELYARADRRAEEMLKAGLADEVERLLKAGVCADSTAMQGIGYKELLPVIAGNETLAKALDEIKLRTRHYIKRQLTWFRADARVRWLAPATAAQTILSEEENGRKETV